MANIPFIGITLPAHRTLASDLEERFETFLKQRRALRNTRNASSDVDQIHSDSEDAKLDSRKPDPWADRLRSETRSMIQRRASAIVERINAQSGTFASRQRQLDQDFRSVRQMQVRGQWR